MAGQEFSEAHEPNVECLMLQCLRSVGQAASHNYKRLNKLSKKVGFIEIGATMATKHDVITFEKELFSRYKELNF